MDLTGSCSSFLNRKMKEAWKVDFSELRARSGQSEGGMRRQVASVRIRGLDSTSTPKSKQNLDSMGDRYIWGRIRRNPRGQSTGSVFLARARNLKVLLSLARPTSQG